MSLPHANARTESATTATGDNRVDTLFARKRAEGGSALIFFLTAGHPDPAATLAAVEALEAGGADLIELGIPFSDPIADGPTIQKSSQCALEGGMTVAGVLDLTRKIRERSALPLILFSAYNPIFRFGEARFAAAAAEAGADGVLVPDLPPEESAELDATCREHGLKTVFLAAPTTTPDRLRTLASHSTGFLYYISLRGVTGARAALPADLAENVERIRNSTTLPVAVGFGIATPEQARAVAGSADGVVVGSALVKLIDESAGRDDFRERIAQYAADLARAVAAPRA